jgi:hypothetical protein
MQGDGSSASLAAKLPKKFSAKRRSLRFYAELA